jgi:hypothetical protein
MEVQAVKINIIEKWSELDNKQVMTFLKYIHTKQNLKALLMVSDMTLDYYRSLPYEMQYELRLLIDKFGRTDFDHDGINQFGRWPNRVRFVKANLSDMTCFQFLLADEYISDLPHASDRREQRKIFFMLIASLSFIKGKPIRERKDLIKRASKMANLNRYQTDYIFRRFFHIKTKVSELLTKQGMIDEDGENSGVDFGWSGIYQDIAERNVFGNVQELYQSRFIDVLEYLIKNKIKADELERQRQHEKAKQLAKE